MIETSVCNSAKKEFLEGVHIPTDRYKLALYLETAELGEKTTGYFANEEVFGQGYDAGGKSLPVFPIMLVNGSASMNFGNVIWEGSIIARGAMIYNASKGNKALATFDFGKDIISTNGPFTVKIPNEGAIILS